MKKLVVPLQAFAALFLCAGMAWMVFVMASINPTPPTAADLQARNTQELSFANMNSTAIALAQQMFVDMVPSPSRSFFMPITGRETVTPTPSAAVTLKPVYTYEASPTPYAYFVSPTVTRRKMDTEVPADTHTPIPRYTIGPPTATATIPTNTEMPTLTPIPTQPAPTDIPTDIPTEIPTSVPTESSPSIPTVPPTVPTEASPVPTEPPTTVPIESTPFP